MAKAETVKTMVYMPKKMKDKLQDKADELGLTLSAYIVVSLHTVITQESVVDMVNYVKEQEEKKKNEN